MQKLAKYGLVIMAIMMMMAACTQDNSSDNSGNNSNNTSTGVVGRWKAPDGFEIEFRSGKLYDGNFECGTYYGNDIEGELTWIEGNNAMEFTYKISGNNMTWTEVAEPHAKEYFTRQ